MVVTLTGVELYLWTTWLWPGSNRNTIQHSTENPTLQEGTSDTQTLF